MLNAHPSGIVENRGKQGKAGESRESAKESRCSGANAIIILTTLVLFHPQPAAAVPALSSIILALCSRERRPRPFSPRLSFS